MFLQLFVSNRFCGFSVDIHILFCFVWVTDELHLSVCVECVWVCVCVLYVACSIGVLVWVCSVCMCLLVFALYTLYLLFITEVHLIWHSEIVVFKCIFFYFCLYARKENTSIKLFIFFRVCLHFLLCLLPAFLFNVFVFLTLQSNTL